MGSKGTLKKPTRPGRHRRPESLGKVAQDAYLHLLAREHGPESLAQVLRVSPIQLEQALRLLKEQLGKVGVDLVLEGKGRNASYKTPGLDSLIRRGWKDWHSRLATVWRLKPKKPGMKSQ